jgi:NADPH-dependent 2,4-dienoyl-CoA reductase/sulfur reductase-like enzyme
MRRVVVVGASLAGLRAVEALRRQGFEGSLTLVGEEAHAPYDRPPLSKQLLRGEWPEQRVRLRDEAALQALALDLRLGVRAQSLDAARRVLHLDDGSELGYDGLVIATGATPRTLAGAEALQGVYVLRTLDDALALRAALKTGPRVCLVGAGFIGLEVAASCRALGLAVTAVEPLELPLSNKIGMAMAEVIAAMHRDHGVELRCGVGVAAIEGGARVERVRLADGSAVEADVVVVGVGVRPAIEWLQGSGIALGDGVVCDETCASSLPDVVAAGDVVSWRNPRFDETRRVEHWSNAGEMASHAVERLLQGPAYREPFAPVPYFWSDQYDVRLQVVGSLRADDELALVEGSATERKLVALYGRRGRLTAALCINRPAQLVRYRRLLQQEVDFASAVREARAGSAAS